MSDDTCSSHVVHDCSLFMMLLAASGTGMKACMNERDSDCIGHPILSDESDFRTSEYNIYWDGPVVYLLANWRPSWSGAL